MAKEPELHKLLGDLTPEVRRFALANGLPNYQAVRLLCRWGLKHFHNLREDFPELDLRGSAALREAQSYEPLPADDTAQELEAASSPTSMAPVAPPVPRVLAVDPPAAQAAPPPVPVVAQAPQAAPAPTPPSEAESEDERRRHQRVVVSLPVHGTRVNPKTGSSLVQGEVTDVSKLGLRLRLPKGAAIHQGDKLRLQLHNHGIATEGVVRHVETDQRGDTILGVGVEITKMSRGHWLSWLSLLSKSAV